MSERSLADRRTVRSITFAKNRWKRNRRVNHDDSVIHSSILFPSFSHLIPSRSPSPAPTIPLAPRFVAYSSPSFPASCRPYSERIAPASVHQRGGCACRRVFTRSGFTQTYDAQRAIEANPVLPFRLRVTFATRAMTLSVVERTTGNAMRPRHAQDRSARRDRGALLSEISKQANGTQRNATVHGVSLAGI